MLDIVFLGLLLLLIAGAALYALYYAQTLRDISRGRRRVFLPPPDIARQLAERQREVEEPQGTIRPRTQLPPLNVPLSEQRLCLRCGTTNLREAIHCRRCGELLGPSARKDRAESRTESATREVPRGPLYAALLLIICASIAMILYQALRLGGRL